MRRILSVLAALLVAAVAAPASAWGADRLVTAVQDPLDFAFHEPDPDSAYQAARGVGATVVRVPVAWSSLAPTRPSAPTSPDDPAYQWSRLDQRVASIHSAGLEPLLVLYSAPRWARRRERDGGRSMAPHTRPFADFAAAAARRYDGTLPALPRVRYWQIWNEPNLSLYFSVALGPQRYRALLNASYSAIHGIAADNTVVAGGLSPFGGGPSAWAPLRFMRALLCVPGGPPPEVNCGARSRFDAWAHHPYTSGGPTHEASLVEDASLGDLPELRRILASARRRGHVLPRRGTRFWITEFSWDSKPPDRWGVPLQRHARWVSEALYRMWKNGASLVTWFALRDGPPGKEAFGFVMQAGLYFRTTERYADERAKPAAEAFRFPFVAVPERGRVTIWGRTPDARRHSVTIERRRGGGWSRLDRIRTNAHGIFRTRRRGVFGATLRARVGAAASLPFKAARTADKPVWPFGDAPKR
jgi:hypothetical protein